MHTLLFPTTWITCLRFSSVRSINRFYFVSWLFKIKEDKWRKGRELKELEEKIRFHKD